MFRKSKSNKEEDQVNNMNILTINKSAITFITTKLQRFKIFNISQFDVMSMKLISFTNQEVNIDNIARLLAYKSTIKHADEGLRIKLKFTSSKI